MPDPTPGEVVFRLHPDLWDDTYLSRDDGRWMAALQGTLGLYEATWQAFDAAYAAGDTHTAAQQYGRLCGLIRRTDHA